MCCHCLLYEPLANTNNTIYGFPEHFSFRPQKINWYNRKFRDLNGNPGYKYDLHLVYTYTQHPFGCIAAIARE